MKEILKRYKFWIIIFFILLFLRLPSLFEPYWYGDEGIYLVLGQAIRKGVALYRYIHDNKPPTLYYLAALGQTIFGFRLLLLLIMLPTVYFFNSLSKFFLSTKGSKIATFLFVVFSSIPLLEGNIANAENFMLLPTIVGILFLTKEKPSLKKIIYSGLLLGLAFTIKIPVAIEFGFLCLWLLIDNLSSLKKIFFNLKNTIIFVLVFLIPIGFWTIYYTIQGAFIPFIKASLLQNFGYLSSWSTGTHTSSVSSGGLVTRFFILIGIWIFIFILKNRNIISRNFSFLLFWFFATIFGALLSGRPYPHYLIQVLPPLILLIVELLNFKQLKNQIISLFSIVFFVLVLLKFNFYHYKTFAYYSNFYSNFIGIKSKDKYQNYFGSNITDIYEISEYIKTNTQKSDKIFIWGDQPYIYALTNRLPSSKYTVAYHIVDFNGYDITMDKIKTDLPKYIVYYQMDNRSFISLDKFINNYYFITKIIGDATIYQLR